MKNTVCCPCGARFGKLELKPGSSFSCGQCGALLTIPLENPEEELLTLEPLSERDPGPRPPAPHKPPAKPKRPVISPAGERPPRRPSPQAPPLRSKDSASPRNPSPKTVQPRTLSKGAPVRTGAKPPPPVINPQPSAHPRTGRQARPAAASRIRRKSSPSPSRAPGPASRKPAPAPGGRKKPSPLQLASIALALVVLILAGVLLMTGGPTDQERAQAYVAGYVSEHWNQVAATFNQPEQADEQIYTDWMASARHPCKEDFYAGLEDSRNHVPPGRQKARVDKLRFDQQRFKTLLENHFRTSTAEQAYTAAQRYAAALPRWKKLGANPAFLAMLRAGRKRNLDLVLKLDPDFAPVRAARQEVKYKDQLLPYIHAGYLEESQQNKARTLHERLKAMASKNAGWIPRAQEQHIKNLEATLAARKKQHEALMASPFYKEALAAADKLKSEVQAIYAKARDWPSEQAREAIRKSGIKDPEKYIARIRKRFLKNIKKRSFVVRIRRPYVVLVEESESWDPTLVAEKDVLTPLSDLNRTFLEQFSKRYGIQPIEKPVPVVFLVNDTSYQQYHIGSHGGTAPGVLAHFEPNTGRLVLHNGTDWSTALHEGTHQLFHWYTKNPPPFPVQSYWFSEGMAEWFSGANRVIQPGTSKWHYEIGLLQEKRFRSIAFLLRSDKFDKPGGTLTLQTLLKTTYGMRGTQPWKTPLVYAQGWMLIYFLNYFKVDPDGMVEIDTKQHPVKGKYRDGWEKYIGMELNGQTGYDKFKNALGLDEGGIKRMADEFLKYENWIMHKIRLKQIKKKRLTPWNKWRNKRNELAGIKEDDMLVRPKHKN